MQTTKKATRSRRIGTKEFNRRAFILLTVVPGFVYFCIFIIFPNILAILLSLYKWNGMSWKFNWVGTYNYKKLFKDPIFYKALGNNVYFALVSMALVIVIALFLAAIMSNKSIKRVGFFRSIFYFPNVMSVVVVSLMWKFMYDPQLGIINVVLRGLGFENLARIWLGDINTVRPALVVPQVWGGVGLYILVYMTTMRSINPNVYESAEIDGASKIRQFFSITLPLIVPTIRTTMIYFMAGALNGGFALVRIMTNGGPNRESTVLTSYLYEKAFTTSDYGYGAAIGVFILIVGFIMYFLIEKIFKSEVYET